MTTVVTSFVYVPRRITLEADTVLTAWGSSCDGVNGKVGYQATQVRVIVDGFDATRTSGVGVASSDEAVVSVDASGRAVGMAPCRRYDVVPKG